MALYPLFVQLEGRRCLVVGGGRVACEKISGLLAAGARVNVLSPDGLDRLVHWSNQGVVKWIRRPWRPGDCQGFFLVIAATNDPALNRQIYEEADSSGQLVNAVDSRASSNFFSAAIARSGPVIVAVSTCGASPALAGYLRDRVREDLLPESIARLAELLQKHRRLVRRLISHFPDRQRFWRRAIESNLVALLEQNQMGQAEQQFILLLKEHAHRGLRR